MFFLLVLQQMTTPNYIHIAMREDEHVQFELHLPNGTYNIRKMNSTIHFKYPVYSTFDVVLLDNKERTTLLMSLTDYQTMSSTLNIWDDNDRIRKNSTWLNNKSGGNCLFEEDVVFVHTIPQNVYYIDGFNMLNTQCRENENYLWDDTINTVYGKAWANPSMYKSPANVQFPSFSINSQPSLGIGIVERIRLQTNESAIHWMETAHTNAIEGLPCLSAGLFVTDRTEVNQFLKELYEKVHIHAFSCYNVHRCIVLYADCSQSKEERLTNVRLTELLMNPTRSGPLLSTFKKFAVDETSVMNLYMLYKSTFRQFVPTLVGHDQPLPSVSFKKCDDIKHLSYKELQSECMKYKKHELEMKCSASSSSIASSLCAFWNTHESLV